MRRLSDCLAMTLFGALIMGYAAFEVLFLHALVQSAHAPGAEQRLVALAPLAEARMWGYGISIPTILTILGFVWYGHHRHMSDQG